MEVLKYHIDRLIKELKVEISLESPKKRGAYFFPIDDQIEAEIQEDPKGIHFFCRICPIPEKKLEGFLTHALHANLFGQGTEGATLGLNSSGKELTLSLDLDYNIDYEEFKNNLEDFINSVETWKEEIAAFAN